MKKTQKNAIYFHKNTKKQ